MNLNNMKNIVIIKNLPSNLVEEAIVVIKDKNRSQNIDKIVKNQGNLDDDIQYELVKEEEINKIKNIQKESRKYIVKEAEMVVNDYLDKINENKRYNEKIKLKKSLF